MPTLEQIKLAESLVSEWLTEAEMDRSRFRGDPINWADLRVVECLWTIDSVGDCGFVITISEASGESQKLIEYLLEKWLASAIESDLVRFVFEW